MKQVSALESFLLGSSVVQIFCYQIIAKPPAARIMYADVSRSQMTKPEKMRHIHWVGDLRAWGLVSSSDTASLGGLGCMSPPK